VDKEGLEGDYQMAVTPWIWVQPKNRDELLTRLADARDLNLPERERENLCACAHAEIVKLVRETNESHEAEIIALRGRVVAAESKLGRVKPIWEVRLAGVERERDDYRDHCGMARTSRDEALSALHAAQAELAQWKQGNMSFQVQIVRLGALIEKGDDELLAARDALDVEVTRRREAEERLDKLEVAWDKASEDALEAKARVSTLSSALEQVKAKRPRGRPEWGAMNDIGNTDDAEMNGYDLCAWAMADIASAALAGSEVGKETT
jgi:chromosome segregation ATPase